MKKRNKKSKKNQKRTLVSRFKNYLLIISLALITYRIFEANKNLEPILNHDIDWTTLGISIAISLGFVFFVGLFGKK